jgi:hypothetical protein
MRCSRGQATLEYVALIAILAVLLSAAVAVATGAGPGIVNAVAGRIRHALCVVGGGPCPDLSPKPCTVAGTRDARHYAVSLIVVRGDHDRHVLREQMSDGTIRLTVARSGAAGAEVAFGGRAIVTTNGRAAGIKNEARGGGQAVAGRGKVFVAADEREAAAFMRAIRAGDDPPVSAREVFYEGGVRGLGTIGVGGAIAGASLRALSGTMAGARRDQRTGDVTLSLNGSGSAWGAVTVAFGGPVGNGDRAMTLGLTLDRGRRATELSISASFMLAAGEALPPGLARPLGRGSASASAMSAGTGGRRWELAGRLDLRDRLAAAAWRGFVDDPTGGDANTGARRGDPRPLPPRPARVPHDHDIQRRRRGHRKRCAGRRRVRAHGREQQAAGCAIASPGRAVGGAV